ncbi:uncharacterized protein LOC119395519 [Rhipicephalus sanguineus]|uniref:uncharacterized protein LOC119395519 n=1 Tax=Rhipicephalus sanguineus TaxID=34632 RepID=UPI001895CE47|nr:uncharacterized protein LOC119395519 [Rhipicephalus sanguineus]
MRSLFSDLWVIFSVLMLAVPLALGRAQHQLKHDTTDAFKTFLAFPHAVAAFDADDDGDLDCMFVVRRYVDEESKTASYMWVLPSVNGIPAENHTYYWREGLTPDKPVFTVDDGASGEQTAHFIYTNYENCAVADIPFKNKPNCGLWVIKDALHSIPQECEDHFEDNCDMTVPVYDEETCKGVLDGI